MPRQRNRRPAPRAGRSTSSSDEVAAEPPAPSDPQEFDFLPVREGREWTPVEVDSHVRKTRDYFDEAEADAGLRAWRSGDMFFELYNGFSERAKGFPSFTAFVLATFDVDKAELNEFLRIRRGVKSSSEARGIGRRKLSLGLRLLARLGLETFAALRNQDLPQPDGETCRFPATVRKLQAALDLLGAKDPAPEPSRRLRTELAQRDAALRVARKSDPDLASASVKFVIHDSEVVLDARHLTAAQRRALVLFLSEGDA